jgi:uncharacterized protein YgiM (DUF1202 family)
MARKKRSFVDTEPEMIDKIVEETVETESIEEPIAEKPVFEAEVKEVSKKIVTVTAPSLNVRKRPSLIGEVLKIARVGDKFDLIKDGDDGFYEVAYNGASAFLMKDYAELS